MVEAHGTCSNQSSFARRTSALPTTLAAQWISAHQASCASVASISDFAEALGLHWARTALRRTQLKIAAGDIRSEGPVDFDICDQGTISHQKLTKAEFGTNAKIATSVRVKDLPSTAACSIRIGLRQIPTSRQANAKSISFEATSCRMLLGHAFAQYWDKPACYLGWRGKPQQNILRQWNESDCADLTRRIASTTFRARYHLSLLQGAG